MKQKTKYESSLTSHAARRKNDGIDRKKVGADLITIGQHSAQS